MYCDACIHCCKSAVYVKGVGGGGMYSIAIVDDDDNDISALKSVLERYFKENGGECSIAVFHDGADLIKDYCPRYDLVFLDIDMERLNGMAAAQHIRKTDEFAAIIFVTRMAKYAIKGYSVSALDFIVKPLEYFSFALKLRRALAYVDSNHRKTVCLKEGNSVSYIDESDIMYIETLKHYLVYHTKQRNLKIFASLKSALDTLSPEKFCMCNRCYIVNLRYVTEIKDNIVVVGGDELIISRYRRKEFMEALARFWGKRG